RLPQPAPQVRRDLPEQSGQLVLRRSEFRLIFTLRSRRSGIARWHSGESPSACARRAFLHLLKMPGRFWPKEETKIALLKASTATSGIF
ncbi:MAG: hypothetical protein KA271_06875, partial [Propionivibrio sp.]|nr:hypothetical protein [Propionivibrio sp.]